MVTLSGSKATVTFVPVRMVLQADDGCTVGLLFGYERDNQSPTELNITFTGLTEEWALNELDLDTVLH
jgi:hypothetical protein